MTDSLVGFLLVITPLVFFHELGHFALARIAGVHVEVFSIGFGKELFGFTDRYGTRWRFSLIPLGGYVKMLGENPLDKNTATVSKQSYDQASLFRRLSIIAAGPIANILLTVVLIAYVNAYFGVFSAKDYAKTGIGAVNVESAAENAGLLEGDIITRMDNVEVKSFDDIILFMNTAKGEPIQIYYVRGDTSFSAAVTPDLIQSENGDERFVLGVSSPGYERKRLGLSEAFSAASQQTYFLLGGIVNNLKGIFSGELDYRDLGGPIKIAQFSGKSLTAGIEQLILFAALLSMNLAVFNLLPIPGLDGGHLVMLLVERILCRPPPIKFVHFMNYTGLIFIIVLVFVVTIKDVFELFA